MESIRFRLRLYLALVIVVLALGMLGFMHIEGLSFVDALYFNLVTIATVGYGDIHPVSQAGKLLAIGLIVTGVGTFIGVVANATELMLQRREIQTRMKKLNMVIGVFFSQVGTHFLSLISTLDPEIEKIRNELNIQVNWTDNEFKNVIKELYFHNYRLNVAYPDLERLKELLTRETSFMLRLLENPNLLEHEAFTDLLWAVFHLAEELMYREDLACLPKSDIDHISADIRRAYRLIVRQWLDYMRHLKDNYPYLFSLSVRTNPFNTKSSAIVG
jgi:voltage-gated potassium channel